MMEEHLYMWQRVKVRLFLFDNNAPNYVPVGSSWVRYPKENISEFIIDNTFCTTL